MGVLCGRDVGSAGSVGAVHFELRHRAWADAKFLHPRDERSPLESKAGSSPTWSANTAAGTFEGTNDLITVHFRENASDGRPSCRFRWRLVG